jgi:hypothetical protein
MFSKIINGGIHVHATIEITLLKTFYVLFAGEINNEYYEYSVNA